MNVNRHHNEYHDHEYQDYNLLEEVQTYPTAVKSNVLAELMNRASKIHWKNLSLTLNGRNSETKNDKNNPKVPFFQYVQLFRNISFLLK